MIEGSGAWKLHKQPHDESFYRLRYVPLTHTHIYTHINPLRPYAAAAAAAAEWLRLFSTRYSNNVFGLFKFLSYSNSSNNNNNNNGTRQAMQMPRPAACISCLPSPSRVALANSLALQCVEEARVESKHLNFTLKAASKTERNNKHNNNKLRM